MSDSNAPVSRGKAYALLAMVTVVWAANWPIMKWGLAFVSPLWFAVARFSLGAASLFAFLAATKRLTLPKRADLPIVFSVGVLQMGAFVMLVNGALLHVPAGRSAILAYTTPLWVLPGAVLFLQEKVERLAVVGLLLGLGGVLLLFRPGSLDWSAPAVVRGHVMLVAAAAVWAASILHVRGHVWRSGPLLLAPFQMLVAISLITPFALAIEGPPSFRASSELFLVLVYNGPIATALCFTAALVVTRALPAMTTSLSFLVVPVLGAAGSALVLGEVLGPSLILAFVSILAGVALVTLADARARSRARAAAK